MVLRGAARTSSRRRRSGLRLVPPRDMIPPTQTRVPPMQTTRRDFLRISAATGGLLGLSGITARGANGLASPTTMRAGGTVSSPGQVAPLRILILGGTGFIGPYEVLYALERGHTVTLFNRGRTNTNLFPDVETLIGDRNGQLDALRGRE